MEIQILKEDKDTIELKIAGEGHTLCNALRSELCESDDTSFASYNLKHPLVSSPVFDLKIIGKTITILFFDPTAV